MHTEKKDQFITNAWSREKARQRKDDELKRQIQEIEDAGSLSESIGAS